MSERDTQLDSSEQYDHWQIEGDRSDDWRFIGVTPGAELGAPIPYLYSPSDDAVYEGRLDRENERITPDLSSGRTLAPEEPLGDVLEDIGDKTGWEWLSEFANDRLKDDD